MNRQEIREKAAALPAPALRAYEALIVQVGTTFDRLNLSDEDGMAVLHLLADAYQWTIDVENGVSG